MTGKGGVGKTTVAAAVALAWRNAGVRTLLVGLDGHAPAARLLSPKRVGYEPVAITSGLWAMTIDLENALKEYARLRLKVKMLADRLVGSQVIDQFTQAAPGFGELMVLGKLWSLSQLEDGRKRRRFEAIVVDAPATGHGLGLLNMAGVVARMFPVGPIAAEARAVDAFVRSDTDAGVLLVTLAEEMPVNETLELRDQLVDHGIHIVSTVVNGMLPDRFTDDDIALLDDVRAETGELDIQTAIDTVMHEHARVRAQQAELQRLTDQIGPVVSLPMQFAGSINRGTIDDMAARLARDTRRRPAGSGARDA